MKVRLSTSERESHAWKKVESVLAERIKSNTDIATNPNFEEQKRYAAAVRCAELKELLKLALPADEPPGAAG